jgi:hypothetical protein
MTSALGADAIDAAACAGAAGVMATASHAHAQAVARVRGVNIVSPLCAIIFGTLETLPSALPDYSTG